jgi:hypothetical protein
MILVVIDRLSKYAHIMALAHPYTPFMVTQVFSQYVMKLHGLPKNIVTNKNSIFTSKF